MMHCEIHSWAFYNYQMVLLRVIGEWSLAFAGTRMGMISEVLPAHGARLVIVEVTDGICMENWGLSGL